MGNRFPLPLPLPTPEPTLAPTMPTAPTAPTAVTYFPGDLTVTRADKYGRQVRLSTGMDGRAIAYAGEPVKYVNGGQSSINFHSLPDGAGVFPAPNGGGFYYASNSEANNGGVGVIRFNAAGEVTSYYRTLSNTVRNCGGGKTPWGTWISCEENGSSGRVWQTDPAGVVPSRRTEVVNQGGSYESFAYDDRTAVPTFYTTEDSSDGELVRFTPNAQGMACYNSSTFEGKWCTLEHGTYDYLELLDGCPNNEGDFQWGPRSNANPSVYPYSEGIDIVDGILYFVSKANRELFILDLDRQKYKCTSTNSGAFNNQPDQIQAILNDPQDIVYFCEDGGSDCGVHGRDAAGAFFSILDGPGYNTESTGLDFSPDSQFMFVSFQGNGVIWQFWRDDGLPFTGSPLDIKYHQ